jgi:tight adherence protein C
LGSAMLATGGFGAVALGIREYANRRARVASRLAMILPASDRRPEVESLFRRIGERLANSSIVGAVEIAKLKHDLYAAGFSGRVALERFIGLKVVLALLFLAAGLVLPRALGFGDGTLVTLVFVFGGAVAGLRGPDAIVAARARGRRDAMDRGLPDALDLLVVCAEAGIGLELALERVAIELRQVHPALAGELGVTVSEMRLLPDRLEGLHNMGERMRLDAVRTIASTLSQTLKYGTPLGKALRTLTADFRLVRATRMEARAARLPVLITVPMIVFILPATTLVVAGPAFLQLIAALGKL